MKEAAPREEDEEEAPAGGRRGALSALALRAIDACMRPLRRWRNRIEPPVEEGDGVEVAAPGADTAPVPKTLLHRALIVLMCLLIGGSAGGLVAYRGFARALESDSAMVERLQEDLAESRKDEVRSYNAKAKYQKEVLEYRKALRETELELHSAKTRVEELNRQLQALKPESRNKPAAAAGRSTAAKPPVPPKTGTCVAGAANTAAELQECLKKFNSP